MPKLYEGDCLDVLKGLPDNSVDAVVTDPPYGLEFMGRAWDAPWKHTISETGYTDGGERLPRPSFTSSRNPICTSCGKRQRTWKSGPEACTCDNPKWDRKQADEMRGFQDWCELWAAECLRVLKPGGHLLAFGGTRTYHRMACAIEDAGFEVRDSIHWMYGCLSEDTEILIDGKWSRHEQAREGRQTLCYDVATDTYAWAPINKKVVYGYDDTAYWLYGAETDQLVSRNHRCLIERDGKWVFEFAENLEASVVVPVLDWAADGPGYPTKRATAQVRPLTLLGRVWCVGVPTGAFVARRNGRVFVTGNSGFPKSLDVSKAIDKAAGAERETLGINPTQVGRKTKNTSYLAGYQDKDRQGGQPLASRQSFITAPATDAARQWEGWGTALKPAHEPIVVARKPLIGTVAQNVLGHGTGAINVDGCRVGFQSEADKASAKPQGTATAKAGALAGGTQNENERTAFNVKQHESGRWPPNVIFSHLPECEAACAEGCAVKELNDQSGVSTSGVPGVRRKPHTTTSMAGNLGLTGDQEVGYADTGGASRFFPAFRYQAKAPAKERKVEGVEGQPMLVLRDDITDADRAFVLKRLRELGLDPEST